MPPKRAGCGRCKKHTAAGRRCRQKSTCHAKYPCTESCWMHSADFQKGRGCVHNRMRIKHVAHQINGPMVNPPMVNKQANKQAGHKGHKGHKGHAQNKRPAHERRLGITHGRKRTKVGSGTAIARAKKEDWTFTQQPGGLLTRNIHNGAHNVPWVRVGPSVALLRRDLHEDGLYAARNFKKGEVIGRYVGKIMSYAEGQALAVAGHGRQGDYIVDLVLAGDKAVDGIQALQTNAQQQEMFGKVLIDRTKFWPGMHGEKINDPRHTGAGPENVLVQKSGFIITRRAIKTGDELLWDYGDEYWIDRE